MLNKHNKKIINVLILITIVFILIGCNNKDNAYSKNKDSKLKSKDNTSKFKEEKSPRKKSSRKNISDEDITVKNYETYLKKYGKKPFFLIFKKKRKLLYFENRKLIVNTDIALGTNPKGHKKKQGDGKTPEGEYYICMKNAYSKFYLSLGISYPNIDDAKAGLKNKLINKTEYKKIKNAITNKKVPPWYTKLGGEIFIHGIGIPTYIDGLGTAIDWTLGCIAVENKIMDVLFERVKLKSIVVILP